MYQQTESIHVLINTKNYYYGQIEIKIDIIYVHRQQIVQEKKLSIFFPICKENRDRFNNMSEDQASRNTFIYDYDDVSMCTSSSFTYRA